MVRNPSPVMNALFRRLNAKIGQSCDISPFCSLENVIIGNNVSIRDGVQLKNVTIDRDTKIGRSVTLYSSEAERPIRIGRSCRIMYGVFGEATGGEIRIGDFGVVAHYTTILTSSGPGAQSPIMGVLFPTKTGSVFVGTHSWIGAHCLLLPGVSLEEGVIIGANSFLPEKKYEAWSVYGGSPAKLIKKIDGQQVDAARQIFRD